MQLPYPQIDSEIIQRMRDKLVALYGNEAGNSTCDQLLEVLSTLPERTAKKPLNESDTVLITYGDHISEPPKKPLEALHSFLQKNCSDFISNVHLLPFFPYSSDDGFSVIDYTAVDPKLGSWSDITALSDDYGLMFDLVLNHISSESEWFQGFLRGDAKYQDYFITEHPDTDLSMVFRPRTLPLLTPFDTHDGEQYVWTTFSPDQIDLNYANPQVMISMIEVLLFYVRMGARFIRMDAATYIRKKAGTPSVHLPETHLTVQLFRDVLEAVAPDVHIITETNVPHKDNISYYGDGSNEAHAVYNFALPPLIVHTLHTGNSTALTKWAKTLDTPGEDTYFFNFTASHDGIGVTPVKNILSKEQINDMVARTEEYGGLVGRRSTGHGTYEPYELNTTFYNALSANSDPLGFDRFMASQAIMLALKGLPGIYIGSLLGNKNWYDGVEKGGYNRAINRQKMHNNPDLSRGAIFQAFTSMLRVRQNEPAFHPLASMEILDTEPHIFALRRTAENGESILAIHNVTGQHTQVSLDRGVYKDLLSGQEVSGTMNLKAYQTAWLKEKI